jgi:hypothetical protein
LDEPARRGTVAPYREGIALKRGRTLTKLIGALITGAARR